MWFDLVDVCLLDYCEFLCYYCCFVDWFVGFVGICLLLVFGLGWWLILGWVCYWLVDL